MISAFEEVETARNKLLSRARIHVERFNQRIKKFRILSGIVPLSLTPLISQIVFITCCLANFNETLANSLRAPAPFLHASLSVLLSALSAFNPCRDVIGMTFALSANWREIASGYHLLEQRKRVAFFLFFEAKSVSFDLNCRRLRVSFRSDRLSTRSVSEEKIALTE